MDNKALDEFFDSNDEWIIEKCLVFSGKNIHKASYISGFKLVFDREYNVTYVLFISSHPTHFEKKLKKVFDIPQDAEEFTFPKPIKFNRKKLTDLAHLVLSRTKMTDFFGDIMGEQKYTRIKICGGLV